MNQTDKNLIWNSVEELAAVVQAGYSVTDPITIRTQYLKQVEQYPLYKEWFNKIEKIIVSNLSNVSVIEYGSGPGILTGSLSKCRNIEQYIVVEPNSIFREMTLSENPKAVVIDSVAEKHTQNEPVDYVLATGAYHHFYDKPLAIQNIYNNLKTNGSLIIAEVFIPNYEFDAMYKPTDKKEFLDKVMKYAAEQIKSMLDPESADIEDQVRTAILDTCRIEELKVCINILKDQLEKIGFRNIEMTLMKGTDQKINYETLGWYFVTAQK